MFNAFLCSSGARPSRVYVRYVEGVPRALCPLPRAWHASLPGGGGVQVRHDVSSEVMCPCRVVVGAQVNHGAWPRGYYQRGKKILLSLTVSPVRCLHGRNCPAGPLTLPPR